MNTRNKMIIYGFKDKEGNIIQDSYNTITIMTESELYENHKDPIAGQIRNAINDVKDSFHKLAIDKGMSVVRVSLVEVGPS